MSDFGILNLHFAQLTENVNKHNGNAKICCRPSGQISAKKAGLCPDFLCNDQVQALRRNTDEKSSSSYGQR